MQKILGVVFIFLSVVMTVFPAQAQKTSGRSMTILAVVNQDAISQTDMQDRLRLILASSGMPDTPAVRERVIPQILDGLIEERLKLQEAEKKNIKITEAEIDQAFQTIAEQNKFTPEQFRAIMKKSGISPKTLEHQIESQIAWNKVVQKIVRPQITVSPNDVAARKARLLNASGKSEYLVSEIFLPVNDGAKENDTLKLAQKLIAEMSVSKNPPPFAAVAAQFSKSPGAEEKGGSLGWVQDGQLPKELNDVLIALPENGMSAPIRAQAGYHILKVSKKRTISQETLPSDDDILNQIGMERLNRAQLRYLADIKAASFIDRKI